MEYPKPLIKARLIRRYKRFLADVWLDNHQVTAHCANTGSMLGCDQPDSEVWLSPADNPRRKLAFTWELVRTPGSLVGINTQWANKLFAEALQLGTIKELCRYREFQGEVKCEDSRLDFRLQDDDKTCYVEVKSVTAAQGDTAIFPDAVTQRGAKHLRALAELVKQGCHAVLFFCIQREDVIAVTPADHIDEQYGRLLRQVQEQGVEILAYKSRVSPRGIEISQAVPLILN